MTKLLTTTSALALLLAASSTQAAVVFADDFEAGANPYGGVTPDVSADGYNVSNTSRKYNTTLWVDTTVGFGSDRQGLISPSAPNETATLPAEFDSQAYAFRYTNSGVTSATGEIGALAAGQVITLSFDVIIDGFNGGANYDAYIVTFNGGTRTDMDGGGAVQGTTSVLGQVSGTAGSTYQTITLTYTVGDDVVDADGETSGDTVTTFSNLVLGHDIGIRFQGQTSAATIDNVSVDISAIPEPGSLALLGLGGLMMIKRRRNG